jgi:hypothetical protein
MDPFNKYLCFAHRDQWKGYVEPVNAHISGFPLVQMLWSNLLIWSNGKNCMLYCLNIYLANTANAVTAFSVNTAVGSVYASGALLFSWDPTKFLMMWVFTVSRALYSASEPMVLYRGSGLMTTLSYTASRVDSAHGSVNAARTAINASSQVHNAPLYIGLASLI